ncbi:MAG: ATP-binding protein [Chloroflexota bacterium]
MVERSPDTPPLLQRFEVTGYKNLTRKIDFGPLGRINVIHGENNVGKSNLLEAMDLFFRCLATPDIQRLTSIGADVLGRPIGVIFNLVDPQPIELAGTFVLTQEQRQRFDLEQQSWRFEIRLSRQNFREVSITSSHNLPKVGKNPNVRINRAEIAQELIIDQVIIDQASRVEFPLEEQTRRRFALLGVSRHFQINGQIESGDLIVPQELRDGLFDAKVSLEAARTRRWELFVEAMQRFEAILGSGRFDTAFERKSNKADLVFDKRHVREPIDLQGSGVQQLVALLGQLLVTPATLVGIEEPELNLRYTVQKQLLDAFQEIVSSEFGPDQLFLTSHSPAFEAEHDFFAMEKQGGVPSLTRKPRALARMYTGDMVEEEKYPAMYRRRPEPVEYVSSEGLVLLPEDVRQKLKLEGGGGIGYIFNKETGRFELWTTDEIEQLLFGDDQDDVDGQ